MISFKDYILNEGINDKGLFKAIFLTGVPGAGKSTTQKELSGGVHPRIINTDKFSREYFGIYKGLYDIYGVATPKSVVDRSKELTKSQLYNYVDGMLPLIIDSTSGNISTLLRRKGILESLGYDTGMVYIGVSKDKAIERNAKRIEQGKGGVSREFIEDTFKTIEENKNFLKGNFTFYKEVQNDFDNAMDINFMEIYSKVQGFYVSEVKNPIGKRAINYLESHNQKLLSDYMTPEKISSIISGWY